jgi:carboxypeptidase D
MKFELSTAAAVFSALALVPSVFARSPIEQIRRSSEIRRSHEHFTSPLLHKRAPSKDKGKFFNNATAKFWVDGTKIPDVDFDVGESYSGLMPISKNANETRELFFWFYPTISNQTEDLVVWLNGGPG